MTLLAGSAAAAPPIKRVPPTPLPPAPAEIGRSTALMCVPGASGVWGLAVCVDPSGLFVTTARAVKGAALDRPIKLTLAPGTAAERTLDARLVRELPEADLALLRLEKPAVVDPIDLVGIDRVVSPPVGTELVVVGYGTLNPGVIGEKNRPLAAYTAKTSEPQAKKVDPIRIVPVPAMTRIPPDPAAEFHLADFAPVDGGYARTGAPILDRSGRFVGLVQYPVSFMNRDAVAITPARIPELLAAGGVPLTPAVLCSPRPVTLVDEEEPAGRTAVPPAADRTKARAALVQRLAAPFADRTAKGQRNLALLLYAEALKAPAAG
ncbi:MAG TPA: serine protease, partial [Humisphaera sp.]